MAEKNRRFERARFSIQDNIEGNLSIPDDMTKKFISAHILDLSQNGVGINFKDNETINLAEGDAITLNKMTGSDALKLIPPIKMKIKWIIDYHHEKGVVVGCEFINISKTTKRKLQEFIDSWSPKK